METINFNNEKVVYCAKYLNIRAEDVVMNVLCSDSIKWTKTIVLGLNNMKR